MRIIKGSETIDVQHPVFLIFGQPGIGKTSLAYSTTDPLLLDFDNGAHRAANRRDTLQIGQWQDVAELMGDRDALAAYRSVIPDTVGRCLDVMTADIIRESPKLGPNGNLSQQGWGTLKTRFRTWVASLRALGKDVLLVAHDKEDKDGDTRVVRPDIVGGSYSEVMKVSDFVGYLYMSGKDRILDFNPTDRWVGKNPGNWSPMKLPPIGKAQHFMAELMDQGRAALGTISEASAIVTNQVDDWRTAIATFTMVDEINRAIPEVATLSAIAAPQVKKLLMDRAKALGFVWNPSVKGFVEPVRPAVPADSVTV
jgi:hypothetical protein